MYNTVYLDERVALTPVELGNVRVVEDVQEMLTKKLKEKHEGKCNANGYVKPGSLTILARSMGVAENGRFTGNIIYDCKFKCEVFYPVGESEMEAVVIKVNKMGAYVHFDEAIRILLPRDLHVGNVEFDSIEEGKTVPIRLERSRFQINDPYIMGVGLLVSRGTPTPVSRRVSPGSASAKNAGRKSKVPTPAPAVEAPAEEAPVEEAVEEKANE
jgi:DNA-directed RNA polymerase subunit E'/Rpb7